MKLLLLGKELTQDIPKDYTVLKINDNNIDDMQEIVDHSCEQIICDEVFENVEYEKFTNLINYIFSKIRLNGNIVFVGIDLPSLLENYQINNIDDKTFNEIVYSKKSIISAKSISDFGRAIGLNIVSLDIRGINYQLILSRLS